MKKLNIIGLVAIIVLSLGLISTLKSQGPDPGGTIFQYFPVLTNAFPASTTNSTKGTPRSVERAIHGVRLTLAVTGINASTNAGTTNSGLTVFFETSPDNGVTWDTAGQSTAPIKLTMTTLDGATNQLSATNVVSDWFNLTGVTKIRQGRAINTLLGVVSNPLIIISYPYPEPVSNP